MTIRELNLSNNASDFCILIVEDMAVNRDLIEYFLLSENVAGKILKAANGKIALGEVAKQTPDLIIMDWEMPEMDGIQTLTELKRNQATALIPVIMLTGQTSSDKLKTAFDSGAIDYIRKPIDKIELLARVNSVLNLSLSNKKILSQKKQIENYNKQITESINYARLIQNSVLTPSNEINKFFKDYFVINLPKSIVSGDFLWFETILKDENLYGVLAVVDCTGHGIPGAFLSIIGNICLRQIIEIEKNIEPDLILNRLHLMVRNILHQNENENVDGMEAAICTIDLTKKELHYAGAVTSLIYVKNNILCEIEGDFEDIAGILNKLPRKYSSHTISFKDGEILIYLFSDGIYDQFGGYQKKRFTRERLLKLLNTVHPHAFATQKIMIEKALNSWKGDLNQTDDILLFGAGLV